MLSNDLLPSAGTRRVQVALSAPKTAVFDDLPKVRNFFAHRSDEAARHLAAVARRNGQPASARAAQIVYGYRAGRPQTIAADWLDDLDDVVTALCA